ncbi:uncharacterized protein LOC124256845 [Haliotis rubra]|uniref:uncharacterized protein LOC124256845 n=1 Tax=Haliotis rubra TaxID=36100 RepID=UPI001EE56892|nr:uncharacterized protein LOC124256845 [Haliotis rubra]
MELATQLVGAVLVIIGLFSGTTLVYIVFGLEGGVLVVVIIMYVLVTIRRKRRHSFSGSALVTLGSLHDPESTQGNIYSEMEPSRSPLQQTNSISSHIYSELTPAASRTNVENQTNANGGYTLPTDATGYIEMTSNNVTTSVDAINQHLYTDVRREEAVVENSRTQTIQNTEEEYLNGAFEDED